MNIVQDTYEKLEINQSQTVQTLISAGLDVGQRLHESLHKLTLAAVEKKIFSTEEGETVQKFLGSDAEFYNSQDIRIKATINIIFTSVSKVIRDYSKAPSN